MARQTAYRTEGSGGPQDTNFGYTWLKSGSNETLRAESVTITWAKVTAAQNGPDESTSAVTFFDQYGRATWSKDTDGFYGFTAYDLGTGAVTKSIVDVQTAGFTPAKPASWPDSAVDAKHLQSLMTVDGLGRTIKYTDPKLNIAVTVFKDSAREVRTYPGWDTATKLTTGPVQLYREDWGKKYAEALTMAPATISVDGSNLPTGGEAVSNVQTLSRSHVNNGGQVIQTDAYFNLTGLSYSTNAILTGAVSGTHYYRTESDYDYRGRPKRVKTPTGTITRAVYDGASRMVSEWVGTDDTPSDDWSPTNNNPPANMVKVRENEYDNGGIGDSNLTKATAIPGLGAANRNTVYFYDWRNRLIVIKAGDKTGELGTGLEQGPLNYVVLDNLGQVTAQEMYDGDTAKITTTNGVPNPPDPSLLRAKSTASYDEVGRVFRTDTFSVDPNTGAVGTYTLFSLTWYNKRGGVVKTLAPGGLVTKIKYDGVGRVLISYLTDGGADSSWNDALSVTGDFVFEQTKTDYDANSNPQRTIHKQRFHDATGTGELGDPATQPKARVSYAGIYYDKADRVTASVNVGTNGGAEWVYVSTAPARSDTVLVNSQSYNAAG